MRICSYRKRSEIEFPSLSLSTGRLNYANMRIQLENLNAVRRTKPLLKASLRFPVEKKQTGLHMNYSSDLLARD